MKTLKTISVLALILFSSIMNVTLAKAGKELKEKIKETVVLEKDEYPLNANYRECVSVSFKVNSKGMLELLNVNYSNKTIKDMLVDKLEEITINESHDSEEIFYYKFLFYK